MTGWHEDQSIWQEGDQGQGRGWSLETQGIAPPKDLYYIYKLNIVFIAFITVLNVFDMYHFPMFPHGFPINIIKIAAAGVRSVRIHIDRQEDGDAAAAPVGVRNAAPLNLTKAS